MKTKKSHPSLREAYDAKVLKANMYLSNPTVQNKVAFEDAIGFYKSLARAADVVDEV